MSTITEYLEELSGRSVTVIGMGISKCALIKMLLRAGVKVTVRDKASREKVATWPRSWRAWAPRWCWARTI